MKILIASDIAEEGISKLKKEFDVDIKKGISKEELLSIIENYDGVIIRSKPNITEDIIKKGKNLKVVARAGVGLDNVDVKCCQGLGVKVVNSPQASSDSVAELAFGLMLAVSRNIARADRLTREKKWEKKSLMGYELNGKTLGIIGFGRIGRNVGKIARACGMSLIAYDPLLTDEQIRSGDAEPVTLEKLIERSNVITLHVPLIESTRHMISDKEFQKMRDNTIIINTSRGGIIDEEALCRAIESGKILGAGLDVFEEEPPLNSKLLQYDSVVLTQHIGASTHEAQKRAGIMIADEVIKALKEK
ncbi:MAG: Glyoxylate reductase [Candidatus Methanofastidiosum methylothiophilum]|uniref:Glyoxylate reductase n=1 Tax=Candidatus Methanofastidiosum methylothiophilum TaxID=1705564 RepID=A0A150J494_9EURY|nr:MAG: Glyoxylate reductase [Candidatus Methanofastidiosum methylthiophilus]NMC76045.1 hydroxyacid dehydrogenase [Candidatus Methanofastidiosa archaeon]